MSPLAALLLFLAFGVVLDAARRLNPAAPRRWLAALIRRDEP